MHKMPVEISQNRLFLNHPQVTANCPCGLALSDKIVLRGQVSKYSCMARLSSPGNPVAIATQNRSRGSLSLQKPRSMDRNPCEVGFPLYSLASAPQRIRSTPNLVNMASRGAKSGRSMESQITRPESPSDWVCWKTHDSTSHSIRAL